MICTWAPQTVRHCIGFAPGTEPGMTIIQKERKPQFRNSFGCKETHKTVGIYMRERENCTCHSINISQIYLPRLKLSMCAQPIQHDQISFLKASSEGL